PHSALDVGTRGRYNTQDNGIAAVQFVSGEYAVTLGARPIGSADTDLLDPLMAAAREIASALQ
ncbi:MAG: hypothetical protein HKN73_13130, partial [Gemmatimonadetes bacterium]|nr:hypothetical protein [Gemmatimonadota bacterium]